MAGDRNPPRRSHPAPRFPRASELHELRREVDDLRRANRPAPAPARPHRSHGSARRQAETARRRRLGLTLGAGAAALVLAALLLGATRPGRSFRLPSASALSRLDVRRRIVAIARSQVGYATDPAGSYCNKFSAYWDSGRSACRGGELSEQWCADFAAWAWRKAGVAFSEGYVPGEINAGSVSFYEWGVAHGRWHPATGGYVAAPGDVAVYGLSLGATPSAAHVAIVTDGRDGRRGPDVINGDGDRTGFSVVETGHHQLRADTGHHGGAVLAGYVSPA